MSGTGAEAVIDCRNLLKIFDPKADAVMNAVKARGLDKTEVHDQFNCVVGVQDASFQAGRGKVFCIIGLSGASKSTLTRYVNRIMNEPRAICSSMAKM